MQDAQDAFFLLLQLKAKSLLEKLNMFMWPTCVCVHVYVCVFTFLLCECRLD